LATGDIILDISSLRVHGDTLYLVGGSAVAKIVFIGIDENATGTKLALIDSDPYTMQLYLYPAGAVIGSRIGAPDGTNSNSAMIPLYISSDVGLRLYTSPDSDQMVNVTYVEMSS
jgi:hypothetical protein